MIDAADLITESMFKVIFPFEFDLIIALVFGIPALLWMIASVYMGHSDDEISYTR